MQKLTASLAILGLMITGSAFAAETATMEEPGKPQAAMERERLPGKKHNDGKPKPPKFEECDKDRDDALNLDEYLACFKRGNEDTFAVIDANKDGKLSRDELRAHHEARKSERRRELFEQCDANKDGVLSFEEFEQCTPPKPDKTKKGKKRPDDAPRP